MSKYFPRYLQLESLQGLLALLATVSALILANSPWAGAYFAVWRLEIGVRIGSEEFFQSLRHWINDGLMVLFFLMVGLEIKREVFMGGLSHRRAAMFPLAAALGGSLAPILTYLAFTWGTQYARGWAVPMATDIAFALSILILLGPRVPNALKLTLAALAIFDDLLAVLVIGLFYSHGLHWPLLGGAAAILLVLFGMNRRKLGDLGPYLLLGLGLWMLILQSGVHATVAGVLLALAVPSEARLNEEKTLAEGLSALADLEEAPSDEHPAPTAEQRAALHDLRQTSLAAESPLQRLETALHPWVAYLVVPLFCFANAGVSVGGVSAPWSHPVGLGVFFGLALGKPLGVMLFTWLAVRLRWATLPDGAGWPHILGLGMLAGVGFTMSLFLSTLAFSQAGLVEICKVAILAASVLSAMAGALLLSRQKNHLLKSGPRTPGRGSGVPRVRPRFPIANARGPRVRGNS